MIRALPAVAAALMLLAAACSGDDNASGVDLTAVATSTPESAVACTPSRTHAPGTTQETITLANDGDRAYFLYVPPAYDGASAASLVFAMHGFLSSATDMRALSALEAAAGERGMIAVFPEGTGERSGWNAEAFAAGTDDVAFFTALLDALESSLCIDATRVFATGFSNGGAMAVRLGCAMPDRIAAIAPVGAPFPACQGQVPMIAFAGNADPLVPYEGGPGPNEGTALPPVHRAVSEWAGALGCDALPTISRAASDVELATYRRCPRGDGETLLYTVLDGGHTWPGSPVAPPDDSLAGRTTQSISATKIILDFFEEHPR